MASDLDCLRELEDTDLVDLIRGATGLTVDEFVDGMHNKDKKYFFVATQNSDRCNQKCSHCFMTEQGRSDLGRPITDGELTHLMEDHKSRDFETYMYFQEPMLRDDFFEKIADFPQQTAEINPAFFVMKKGLLEKVLSAGIVEIKHSIHGRQEEHSALTKASPRLYQRMLDGMRAIKAAGLRLGIESTFYQGNKGSVAYLAELFADIGVDDWYIGRAIPVGAAARWPLSMFLLRDDAKQVAADVARAIEEFSESGLSIRFESNWGPNFFSKWHYQYLLGKIEGEPIKSTYWCDAIDSHMLYTSTETGRVFPCFYHLGFEDQAIGSYNADSRKIDFSKSMLEKWTSGYVSENLRGMCSKENCPFHSLCLGGCRATAMAFAKVQGDPDPFNAGMDFCLTNELLSEKG